MIISMSGLVSSSIVGYDSEISSRQKDNPLVGISRLRSKYPISKSIVGLSNNKQYNTNKQLNKELDIESYDPDFSFVVSSIVLSMDLRTGCVLGSKNSRSLTVRTNSMLGNIQLRSRFMGLKNQIRGGSV